MPSAATPFTKGFTDVIFANWAQGDKGSPCTLKFYKSFPYQGARQYLLNPFAQLALANQDNFISPSYESAETSAVKATATILKNFR